MANRIKIGEKVLATSGHGPWGSRQFIGKLERILPKPDMDGNKYVVEVPGTGLSIHHPTSIRVVKIRRVSIQI